MSEHSFTDADGIEVGYRRWMPDAAPRAAIVIVHGASEHSGRYERVGGVLTGEGFAVYAIDLRGHGRTADATGPGKIGPRGMDGLLDDVSDLIARARDEIGGGPVVLFGHSLGSLVAQAFVERRGTALDEGALVAYVLSGAMGPMEGVDEMAAGIREAVDAGMADEPLNMLGAFNAGFEPARTTYDWLSRDPDEVDKYLADPLCGDDLPLTYGFVAAMLETVADAMEPEGVARTPKHLPVLLLTGEEDPVSNGAAAVRELERLLRDAGLDVTAKYYPGARHEVLNETNRDEVHQDLTDWLKKVVPSA